MTFFDDVWDSITKFDFHFGDYAGGHYARPELVERRHNQPMGHFASRRYGEYDPKRDFNANSMQAVPGDDLGPNMRDPPKIPTPSETVRYTYPEGGGYVKNVERYHRGSSKPRLHEDGSYTGVNLTPRGKTTDSADFDFDEFVDRAVGIGAHETVHRLIEDEIDPWARERSGIDAVEQQMEEKKKKLARAHPEVYEDEIFSPLPGFESLEDFPPSELRDTGVTDEDLSNARRNFRSLRSLGHEFGAYRSTPDSSQPSGFASDEKARSIMSNAEYYPAISDYASGKKPFSDLHQYAEETKKSFDTVWDLMKARIPTDTYFPYSHYHGTSVENAKKIMSEGANDWFFGTPHREHAEEYALDHDAPAMLGFSVPPNLDELDPHDYGYDFGTEDMGHIMTSDRLDPRHIRLIALGREGMDWDEWYRHIEEMEKLTENQYRINALMESPEILDLYRRRYS